MDEMLAVSQSFPDRSALEACITSIRNSVKLAVVLEDERAESMPPFFRVSVNSSQLYSFCMMGMQNEILMNSEGYQEKETCVKSLESFKYHAQEAKILDLI